MQCRHAAIAACVCVRVCACKCISGREIYAAPVEPVGSRCCSVELSSKCHQKASFFLGKALRVAGQGLRVIEVKHFFHRISRLDVIFGFAFNISCHLALGNRVKGFPCCSVAEQQCDWGPNLTLVMPVAVVWL